MKRIVLLALAAGVLSQVLPLSPAEAHRSCGHGKIYRVSMGICVGAHSHLAYGYAGARRTIRYGRYHRLRFALRSQPEEEGQADERERRAKPKPPPVLARHHHSHQPRMLQVVEPEAPTPPPPEEAEVPYVIDMPFGIYGSRLMRPPSQPYWRLP